VGETIGSVYGVKSYQIVLLRGHFQTLLQ